MTLKERSRLTDGVMLSEKEQRLIEQVRQIDHGKVEAVIVDGKLVRIVKTESTQL